MKGRRSLREDVNRWKMDAYQDDPPGCGFPICTIIDSKPKRFRSTCDLAGYMKENGLYQRVLHFQKGDCADASEYGCIIYIDFAKIYAVGILFTIYIYIYNKITQNCCYAVL